MFEAFAIAGRGNFFNRIKNLRTSRGVLSGNLTKYALQFNFGLRKNRFEFAYSMKPTFFNISDLEGELTYDGVDQKALLTTNDNYSMIEHALTMKILFDNIDLQFQIGRSARQFDVDRTRINTYLGAGFILNINEFSAK